MPTETKTVWRAAVYTLAELKAQISQLEEHAPEGFEAELSPPMVWEENTDGTITITERKEN